MALSAEQAEIHDALFARASAVVGPYVRRPFPPTRPKELEAVRQACEDLEEVLALNEENVNALIILGICRRWTAQNEASYRVLSRAYALARDERRQMAARELWTTCHLAGRDDEAFEMASYAARHDSATADNWQHLALASAVVGRFDLAAEAIARARSINPRDRTARRLQEVITSVVERRFDHAEKLSAKGVKSASAFQRPFAERFDAAVHAARDA